jgi:hypothetical protein
LLLVPKSLVKSGRPALGRLVLVEFVGGRPKNDGVPEE